MNEKQLVASNVSEFLVLVTDFTNQWFSKEKTWGPLVSGAQRCNMGSKADALP